MIISSFMIPADKVAVCHPKDPLKVALEAMVTKKIGAIVVVDPNDARMAVGILTKTDFVEAYNKGLALETPVKDIMSKDLRTLRDNLSTDHAVKLLEDNKTHHAIVVDSKGHFAGIVSSWDICADRNNERKAWPWNRSEDGKFHKPNEVKSAQAPGSPTSVNRESHTFLDYVDSVRDLPFMDD